MCLAIRVQTLQCGKRQSFPRLHHLLARLVVWTTHQGQVALGKALATQNRAPKAEVEAVEGGAEESPAVPNSPK